MIKPSFVFVLIAVMILSSCGVKCIIPDGASKAAMDKLSTCPSSPNCISSLCTDSVHGTDPLTFNGTASDALNVLKKVIGDMPRTKIIEVTPDYVKAEFQTPSLRYTDDVEFYIDATVKIIHVRSASRVGYYDFGVNRERVEAIEEAFRNEFK